MLKTIDGIPLTIDFGMLQKLQDDKMKRRSKSRSSQATGAHKQGSTNTTAIGQTPVTPSAASST
jgi:hypothetical protein